jgi:hypothetical protein
MKGCVFQRKGEATWTVKYDRPRDPLTGKRRPTTKGGFRTKGDAEWWARRTLGAMDEGSFVEPSRLTLGQVPRGGLAAGAGRP